jgi:hypothetical protein
MFSLQRACETVSQLMASSGVVVNGRQLSWPEAVLFQQLCRRPIPQGRYQVNARGDLNHESGALVCNLLAQMAQRANNLPFRNFPGLAPPHGHAGGQGGGGLGNPLAGYVPTDGSLNGSVPADPSTGYGPAVGCDIVGNPFLNYDTPMPTYDPTMMDYGAALGGFDPGLFGNTNDGSY